MALLNIYKLTILW